MASAAAHLYSCFNPNHKSGTSLSSIFVLVIVEEAKWVGGMSACFATKVRPPGGNCRTEHVHTGKLHHRDKSTPPAKFHLLKAKAAKKDRDTKPKSVICTDCDGNVLCSQCKGSGVNSEDMFNGEFKAGDDCWLCGGRKEMLCGNCNGAGFLGGFMSTFDQ
ncbi:protein BUNDLE SHEATH DEFECTIVE 2, chloroplastic-like isoform X2 [Punica granatum]|uniref:Protein BUNDLE SHEATH DEFECTIVE 2, chloroplastic-like isoform X2 n=1 Tax=Punica granatum TaxID=22663 RepID=A0A6P8BQU9_PUNGR|nr:protein BUNDLE SHEATH DEFECTIVE 2, chloroplastic-like isoform X2 [Punica granatum]